MTVNVKLVDVCEFSYASARGIKETVLAAQHQAGL
jgi:hypothetical protein